MNAFGEPLVTMVRCSYNGPQEYLTLKADGDGCVYVRRQYEADDVSPLRLTTKEAKTLAKALEALAFASEVK